MIEENKLIVIDEDGSEKEMNILFTFDSEDYGKSYVFFYDENNDEEMIVASYDDDGNLFTVEDEAEWAMCSEMLDTYDNESFQKEIEAQDA